MNIPRMAWRNVWRNRRRTAVTILAMALALFVCVLYSGMIAGYLKGMTADLIELGVGEIQVFDREYRNRPSIYAQLEDAEARGARLEAAGFRVSAQLLGGGLAATDEFNAGVQLIGIDPSRFAQIGLVQDRLQIGSWVDPKSEKGVVVGRGLARTLDVTTGDEIVILTQATDGSMGNDLYIVQGILGTVSAQYDRGAVFMNASAFRELMVFEAGAHQLLVRIPAGVAIEDAKRVVSELAGEEAQVLTWKELFPSIATMLESTEGLIYLLYFVFYVAIGILILNAMLMAVFERVKELGVLKAIGLAPGRVVILIFLEAGIQIAMAVILGLVVSLPGMWYLSTYGIQMGSMGGMNVGGLSMSTVWYGLYTLDTLQAPVLMLVFMSTLAVIYPAYRAARISPIVAMRHQ